MTTGRADGPDEAVRNLALPFTAYRCSGAESTRGALTTWASELSLLEMRATKGVLSTIKIGDFSSYTYPFADMPTRVLIDSWVLWTLIIDELFEETLAAGRLNRTASASPDPFVVLGDIVEGYSPPRLHLAALQDLCKRTQEGMAAEWCGNFLGHVAKFVRSCHLEALNRSHGNQVDLAYFVELRRGSFAADMFLDLVEKVEDAVCPREPRIDDISREIRECAADVAGWCNDVLSYRREAGAENQNNLVHVLAQENGWQVETAVCSALARIHDRAWRFIALNCDLANLLREQSVDDVTASRAFQWARSIEILISGSLTFQRVSRRWQET